MFWGQLFDNRNRLRLPQGTTTEHLKGLSLYAFWRVYDVSKGRLVKKQREQFPAVTGLGWPAHAKAEHPNHVEYAKRSLLCYMPCPGLRGTDAITELVHKEFRGSWPFAFRAFVMDVRNLWCPMWVLRNYEVQNDILQGLSAAESALPSATVPVPPPGSICADRLRWATEIPHAIE